MEKIQNEEKLNYLMRYRRQVQAADEMREELDEMKSLMEGRGSRMNDVNIKKQSDRSGLERQVERMEDRRQALAAQERKAAVVGEEVAAVIEELADPRQRRVLRFIYLMGMSQREVAMKMGYCRRQISRDHQDAVAAIHLPENSLQ